MTKNLQLQANLIDTIKLYVQDNKIQQLSGDFRTISHNQQFKNQFFDVLMNELINHPEDKHYYLSTVFGYSFDFKSDYFYKKTISISSQHSQDKLNYVLKYFFSQPDIFSSLKSYLPLECQFYELNANELLNKVKQSLDIDFTNIKSQYRNFLLSNLCEKLIEKRENNSSFVIKKIFLDNTKKIYIDDLDTISSLLIAACKSNKIDIVKYLLTSPDLNYKADIHYKNDDALKTACYYGAIDIVDYLLTSSELSDHANIYLDNCSAFKKAYNNNHERLVEYLIYDYGLKKTQAISDFLDRKYNGLNIDGLNKLRKVFESRDFYVGLEEKLEDKKITNNKIKV